MYFEKNILSKSICVQNPAIFLKTFFIVFLFINLFYTFFAFYFLFFHYHFYPNSYFRLVSGSHI